MKIIYCLCSVLLLCSCSNSQSNSLDLNNKNQDSLINNQENKLNNIRIGDNVEFLKKKFKKDIIFQNYSDITDMKECQNSKNILVNNTLTSIDINGNGIVTSIHTRDSMAVDANNISVGKLEGSINKLNSYIKPEKKISGDDSIYLLVYKIPMKDNKGFFIYSIGDDGKIESISIESVDHISCGED